MDLLKQLMRACLLVIISLILDVYSRKVCYSTSTTVYYCDYGYYCCHFNTRCCFGLGGPSGGSSGSGGSGGSDESSESGGSGLSAGAIAGIVIGCVAFVICICVIWYCVEDMCMKRHGRITQVKPVQQSEVSVISTGNQHSEYNYGQHDDFQQSAYDTNFGISIPGNISIESSVPVTATANFITMKEFMDKHLTANNTLRNHSLS